MKRCYQLGEKVFVKADVIRMELDPNDEKRVLYSVRVKSGNGASLILNCIEDETLEWRVKG